MTDHEGTGAGSRVDRDDAGEEFDPSRIVGRIAEYDEALAEDVGRIIERGVELHDAADELEAELDDREGLIEELRAELERKDERIERLESRVEDRDGESGDGGDDREVDPERVERLEQQLEEREQQIEDLKQRLKRKQADFENYKKRAEQKRERIKERATEDLIERLLDVRDDLRRATENEHPDVESLRDGVEMTLREFDRVLDDEEVTEIDPEPGEEVDPQRHEVMMRVDSDQPEGAIAEVYSPGYEMADEVIRPAQVTVSADEDS